MAKPKILLYLAGFFFFISAFVFLPRVFAQDASTVQERNADAMYNTNPNLQQLVGAGMIPFSLSGIAESIYPTKPEEAPAVFGDGALISTSNLVAYMYENKPANTEVFVADLLQDVGISQPAYAQGLGFSSLQPILEIWKIFRNIAYVIFVLIMLVIGFAIMFRKNLGGQAEVTVQQALPKIVVALLAVTFSYAIAGLLIDLMYVLMFFLIVIFNASGLVNTDIVSTTPGPQNILGQNIFEVASGIISNGFQTQAGSAISELISNTLGGEIGAQIVGGVSGLLTMVILLVAILIATFKLFFALLKVYLEIVLSIIFAPIILMMGAIQGSAFGNWVKSLAINLLVFPVLLIFIMIGYMFMSVQSGNTNVSRDLNDEGFVPPFVPGRGNAQNMGLLIGIGAFMLMSNVPEIVGRYKPKSPFEDLGGMAFKNAIAGDVGIPLVLGGGNMALGSTRTAIQAYRQGYRGRDILKAVNQGFSYKNAKGEDVNVPNYLQRASAGLGAGQRVRKYIDDLADGRGLPFVEPDNFRSQLEQIIKNQKSGNEKSSAPDVQPPKVKG